MTAKVLNWTFSSTLVEFFFCFYPNTHWDAEQLCMQLVHWKHNDDLLYSALWKWVMFGYLSSRSELHLYMEKNSIYDSMLCYCNMCDVFYLHGFCFIYCTQHTYVCSCSLLLF